MRPVSSSLFFFWKAATALVVLPPHLPSTKPGRAAAGTDPTSSSLRWTAFTPPNMRAATGVAASRAVMMPSSFQSSGLSL